MLRRLLLGAGLSALTLAMLVLPTVPATSPADGLLQQERSVLSGDDAHEFGDGFMLALGGKLYDDLWSASDATPPMARNPSYPANENVSVTDTWRCVSCHGWDYKGTGKMQQRLSLRQLDGKPMPDLRARFDKAHPDYAELGLGDLSLDLIMLFLGAGQVDHAAFQLDKPVPAINMARGQDIFEGVCMNCHDPDGTAGLPPRDDRKPSLGWLARNRPNQVLHRIINGYPGQAMLALRFMEDAAVRDLIAYMRSLAPNTP